MPVSSSRPKRKSRGDAYPEDNSGGGGGGAGIVGGGGGSVGLVGGGGGGGAGGKDAGTLQKENNAPATTTRKKKRREDGAERPPSKKQKKATSAPMQNDDGFIFRTRSTTRSSKAAEIAQSTQTTSSLPPPAPDPPKRKTTKKRTSTPPPPPVEEQPKKAKAGKEEKAFPLAAEVDDDVKMVQEVKAVEKKKGKKKKEKVSAAPVAPPVVVPRSTPPPPPSRIPTAMAGGGGGDATKVVLHVSDTPIIRKNQQLRQKGGQGNRRSSVGLRGRRASSLMDTGIIAEPHAEIAPEDFYKHIHDEIVEPQRMKQLLSWCGRRALTPAAPTGDKEFNARSIARIIEEELLSDILSNSALSSWFNREDSLPSNVVKKPNPRNTDNLAKVEECQVNLKRLRDEKETWLSLLKSTSALSLNPDVNLFDTSLYLPAESSFASTLSQSADLLGSTKRLVKQHAGEIEFQVDQLIDGIHKLQQYGEAADRLGARVLEDAEKELAKREVRVRQVAGTEALPLQEVLRSLSRLDR